MDGKNLPALGSPEAMALFLAMYQTRWGPHPAAKAYRKDDDVARLERDMWSREIEQIQPRHFEQICELIALDMKDREATGKPKLTDLKKARLKIEGRYRLSAGNAPRPKCGLCGGTGTICVPAATPNEGHGWTFDPAVAVLYDFSWPCKCSVGRQVEESAFRHMSKDVIARARQTYDNAVAAADPCDGREMTLAEFLQEHPDGGMVTPRSLLDAMREESMRLHGIEVPAYEKGATIAALKARHGPVTAETVAEEVEKTLPEEECPF